jgi:hypothetical protein
MQTFPVTFSRNPVIVLILVTVPLIIVAIFLLTLFSIPNLPDWAIFVGSFVMMAVNIATVLFIYKKWATARAEVDMSDEGLRIRMLSSSPFYPSAGYQSSWEGIENVSTNFDPQHDKRFYMLSFRHLGKSISLMPAESASDDAETPFGDALLAYVSKYNSAHKSQPETLIHQKGFYDTWWAKGLTIFTYLIFALVVVMRLLRPNDVSIWRLVQVACFGILWLSAYYTNRKHARAKHI